MENLGSILDFFQKTNKDLSDKLDLILIQTTSTTERVSNSEKKLDSTIKDVEFLKNSSSEMKGRDKAIWIFTCFISGIIGIAIQYFITLKK